MAKRSIVYIDEERCDGCGVCIPSCAEGALKIVNGKAKLMADKYCDGLGACLGNCPKDAITIIEREADEFDEAAVEKLLARERSSAATTHFSCPGSRMMDMRNTDSCPGSKPMELKENSGTAVKISEGDVTVSIKSQLTHWPVQLMLVPVSAPYFDEADLLITADCVPVADPYYHLELLKGKSVVIGCPKLDDGNYYVAKLAEILRQNSVRSITVAHMEVPCCSGMIRIAREALALSGKDIPMNTVEIKI